MSQTSQKQSRARVIAVVGAVLMSQATACAVAPEDEDLVEVTDTCTGD